MIHSDKKSKIIVIIIEFFTIILFILFIITVVIIFKELSFIFFFLIFLFFLFIILIMFSFFIHHQHQIVLVGNVLLDVHVVLKVIIIRNVVIRIVYNKVFIHNSTRRVLLLLLINVHQMLVLSGRFNLVFQFRFNVFQNLLTNDLAIHLFLFLFFFFIILIFENQTIVFELKFTQIIKYFLLVGVHFLDLFFQTLVFTEVFQKFLFQVVLTLFVLILVLL